GRTAAMPAPRSPAFALRGEHGSGDFDGPFIVEDPVPFAELPVRDALMRTVGVGVVAGATQLWIVAVVAAVGSVGMRFVRDGEEEVMDLRPECGCVFGELGDAIAEYPVLLLPCGRLVLPALPVEASDVLGPLVELSPHVVSFTDEPPL